MRLESTSFSASDQIAVQSSRAMRAGNYSRDKSRNSEFPCCVPKPLVCEFALVVLGWSSIQKESGMEESRQKSANASSMNTYSMVVRSKSGLFAKTACRDNRMIALQFVPEPPISNFSGTMPPRWGGFYFVMVDCGELTREIETDEIL